MRMKFMTRKQKRMTYKIKPQEQEKVDKAHKNLRNFSLIATVLFNHNNSQFHLIFDNLNGDRLKMDWDADKLYSK
jgi:hypothetical protein